MATNANVENDPEFVAMSAVYAALKGLEPEVQNRILNYIAKKLNLASPTAKDEHQERQTRESVNNTDGSETQDTENIPDETDGISPSAKKWLTRNGLQANQVERIFSVGGDEIDLIADTVPGKAKKQRMYNVFLLKGVAAYLGTGAARFSHEQVKEACLHYDAYDAANFAAHIKGFASEVSGSKETGYTLNARGLAAATKLVKEMIAPAKT